MRVLSKLPILAAALAIGLTIVTAHGDDYPSRTIRLVRDG